MVGDFKPFEILVSLNALELVGRGLSCLKVHIP